jgi:hypothetical protein
MEATWPFEMLVSNHHTTRHNKPENHGISTLYLCSLYMDIIIIIIIIIIITVLYIRYSSGFVMLVSVGPEATPVCVSSLRL